MTFRVLFSRKFFGHLEDLNNSMIRNLKQSEISISEILSIVLFSRAIGILGILLSLVNLIYMRIIISVTSAAVQFSSFCSCPVNSLDNNKLPYPTAMLICFPLFLNGMTQISGLQSVALDRTSPPRTHDIE